MKYYKLIVIVFLFLQLYPCKSQQLTLDEKFIAGNQIAGFNNKVEKIIALKDGKILVAGRFTDFNGVKIKNVALLNSDGTLNTSLKVSSGFTKPLSSTICYFTDMQVQEDGKIVLTGDFKMFDDSLRAGIVRLNRDGSLDQSFRTGTGFKSVPRSLKIQKDGKILVAGPRSYNDKICAGLLRLNTDGSLDTTFKVNAFEKSRPEKICLQEDNKILVINFKTTEEDMPLHQGLLRLHPDGSVDSAFSVGNTTYVAATDIAVTADNKIYLSGILGNYAYEGPKNPCIIKLNADGSPDTGFKRDSLLIGSSSVFIDLQENGKILLSGIFDKRKLYRLSNNGDIEDSLILGNKIASDDIFADDILSLNNNKFLIYGDFKTVLGKDRYHLAKCSFDTSTADDDFIPVKGFNDVVNDILVQPDGKVLVAGRFSRPFADKITRLNVDGSIDEHFDRNIVTGGIYTGERLNSIALQKDQKILAGGYISTFKGREIGGLFRLTPEGKYDSTFNLGLGFKTRSQYATEYFVLGEIRAIAVQEDGKILVGGDFDKFNDVLVSGIVRLNTNGTLDQSFNVNLGRYSDVNCINLLNDGKILIAGSFASDSQIQGREEDEVIVVDMSGKIDLSFKMEKPVNNFLNAVAVQNDGKIILAGGGVVYSRSGVYHYPSYIMRLNSNGDIDSSFTGKPGEYIYALKVLHDGKILAGGSFTDYAGNTVRGIVRLNPDGSFDSKLYEQTGAESREIVSGRVNDYISINAIAEQTNGEIILGGYYKFYDGKVRHNILKLSAVEVSGIENVPLTDIQNKISVYPNPAIESVNVKINLDSPAVVILRDIYGNEILKEHNVFRETSLNTSNLAQGLYVVEVRNDNNISTVKVLIQ